MPDWLVWLLVAAAFAAAETTSLDLVLVMFGGGAAAAAVAGAIGAPVIVQVVVAIVGTLALLVGARPIAKRHLTKGTGALTGSDRLVGSTAVVLAPVDVRSGRVRLNGAEWSARTFEDGGEPLAVGREVRVVQIDGATAVVLAETATGHIIESGEQP